MSKQLSFVEARNNLSLLVDEVSENKTRIIIQKRGKDKVVMISVKDYLRSVVPVDPIFFNSRQQAQQNGTKTLNEQDIEAEINSARIKIKRQKKDGA